MFNFTQPKPPHAVTKNGNVSSGFFSDQSSSKPSQLKQSVSSTHLPRELTSSDILVQSGHSTVPNLTSLWGPSAIEASKRRVSVGAVNARNSSRSGSRTYITRKTSTIGQAPVTTPEIDILRELVFTLNGVGGNLIKFDQLTDVFRACYTTSVIDVVNLLEIFHEHLSITSSTFQLLLIPLHGLKTVFTFTDFHEI
ncbi:hypothetical protein PHET_11082 [Paragonimus heterotremus]|uniref:Uncharacterized protein n=1 Tax=Paragonimus heterotremus TaxID=100268 RepID=A0A8J4SL24_9TREM|nr:hypothetical protein PHET_11082 [Paragonimus heterotremus]